MTISVSVWCIIQIQVKIYMTSDQTLTNTHNRDSNWLLFTFTFS